MAGLARLSLDLRLEYFLDPFVGEMTPARGAWLSVSISLLRSFSRRPPTRDPVMIAQ